MVKLLCPLAAAVAAWKLLRWVQSFEINWDLPFEAEPTWEAQWTWN